MSEPSYQTGLSGEDLALRYLLRKGMLLLAKRYRAADGEIDLIMQEGSCLVFVEVKYRPSGRRGDGLLSISAGKQRRILHAATVFYTKMHDPALQPRFDVVEITADGIFHLPDAFRPG